MKNRKTNIKALVLIILFLVFVDSIVFIITKGFGKNLVVNMGFYILEILITIWIIKDNGNRKKWGGFEIYNFWLIMVWILFYENYKECDRFMR